MRRILLALAIFATAAACLFALSDTTNRGRQQLEANQAAWLSETQQFAEVQGEQAALVEKVRELKRELPRRTAASSMDPALVDFLLTDDATSASPDMQDRILAGFGPGGNSSSSYVLVSKAALKKTTLKPLKTFPNGEKLTAEVRGVLAITPEEQVSVEAAFAEAFAAVATWAKANVQREGPSGDFIVRYTIPTDPVFEQTVTNKLFSTVNAAIGDERGELLRSFFETWRIYEDGAIGERTNIFSIHRISEKGELGYRSGWKWANAEAINTFPEPIKIDRFPYAFLFVFPGGWAEFAQREGFLPPEKSNANPK